MENDNNAQKLNNNNQLESIQTNVKQLVAKVSIGLGLLLLLCVFFWFYKSSNKDDKPIEEKNDNLIDSVKNEKIFSLTDTDSNKTSNTNTQNILNLQQYSSSTNSSSSSPFQEQVIKKPRIIKGMSAAVISPKTSNDSKVESNSQMLDKPQKVLDFGQDDEKIIDKITDSLPQYDEFGNVKPKTKKDNYDINIGEVFQPTSAHFSDFNQTFLLPKGSYIPCSLKTHLVSELKGGIACIIANDIYSANGQVLLIEKGSEITGTYSDTGINDASTRLFVIWQEIRTPNNIIIPLYSGASDTLGGSGIEGYVDKHYIERFGSAILLSIIDGSVSVLGNYISSQFQNGGDIQFNEASQLAEMALRQTIGIKPTIYKNQGDLVGVYVNKNIDFSKVYQLRRKK